MNMIQKMFKCETPMGMSYEVSAWQAMGSNNVNITTKSNGVWDVDYPEHGLTRVQVEKLSHYASRGVRTMEDLISHLFYVKA